MNAWKHPLKWLSSLRLTVVLLVLSMGLILGGTLEQVHIGIYAAKAKYFESFFVFLSPPGSSWRIPVLPGGFLIGGLLLVNLIAAQTARFKLTASKAGIHAIHLGIIVLLCGELGTALFSSESQLRFREGETRSYSESLREFELAVITSEEEIVMAPLVSGANLAFPSLPFEIRLIQMFKNSVLLPESASLLTTGIPVNLGEAKPFRLIEAPETGKQDERNMPSALLELTGAGQPLGERVASSFLPQGQAVEVEGKSYLIVMRPRRFHTKHSLQLVDFTHEKYEGTDIPRDFASRVRLVNPEKKEDREVLIYMNHPLRYEGRTYYQASFGDQDRMSILQVVQNPNWLLPYIACSLVGLGLVYQFLFRLSRANIRQTTA